MAETTEANGPKQPLLKGDAEADGISPISREGARNTELSSVMVDTGAADDVDEITPASSTYGATDAVSGEGEGEKKKDGKKKEKKPQKLVADALKTDMAAERTFFKWLWTGLHTGAIGSFIFITFDGNREDPMRLVVVGFSWLVALGLVLYGTFAFYRRRHALRTGDISVIPNFTREHSPLVVVIALGLVVGTALLYAGLSNGFSADGAKNAASAALGGA